MLGERDVWATIAVKDIPEARQFYEETLGLEVVREKPHIVLYKSGRSYLEIYQSDNAGASQTTVATWDVNDIEMAVERLKALNVSFERYEALTGAEVHNNIYSRDGQRAAWFKDPSGNILSLHEGAGIDAA